MRCGKTFLCLSVLMCASLASGGFRAIADEPTVAGSTSSFGYLKNGDLKEGWTYWHGSGEMAFLNKDGSEGSEGDKDVIPVIKIPLSHGESREVYQDYNIGDSPDTLNFNLDIFASKDFKRSSYKTDYNSNLMGNTEDWSWYVVVPCADFWIRSSPAAYFYITRPLMPGAWTTVNYSWPLSLKVDSRTVYFCVPPGDGVVYIKNPSITGPNVPAAK
jgi:hypothetical protein